jgi:hypothetical protein
VCDAEPGEGAREDAEEDAGALWVIEGIGTCSRHLLVSSKSSDRKGRLTLYYNSDMAGDRA